MQNLYLPVIDDETRTEYKALQEISQKIYNAKWDKYVDDHINMYQYIPEEMFEDLKYGNLRDKSIKSRVHYMYNYMDYRHFRHQVRHKFINDMHKKSTLEDIGESLDDLIFESKARVG